MQMSRVALYRLLFTKSFSFDKFAFKSVYGCPRISSLTVKAAVPDHLKFKSKFYKLLILFYLLTGQKPCVLIDNYSVRGVKKKRISSLLVTTRNNNFFDFIVLRQLTLIPFFKQFSIKNLRSSISFNLIQQAHDDDIFLQLIKISEIVKYRVSLQTTATSGRLLRVLLINFKIPC